MYTYSQVNCRYRLLFLLPVPKFMYNLYDDPDELLLVRRKRAKDVEALRDEALGQRRLRDHVLCACRQHA
jgi:hypothetical protein